MADVSALAGELVCRVIYFGPSESGKRAILHHMHEVVPPSRRSDLVNGRERTGRIVHFDYLPIDLGTVGDLRLRFQLCAVPGDADRQGPTLGRSLSNADAIVFVADSNPVRREDNIMALVHLHEFLRRHHPQPHTVPIVLQYHKRDLDDCLPVDVLDGDLNPDHRLPVILSSAVSGTGIFPTLRTVTQLVARNLQQRFTDEEHSGGYKIDRRETQELVGTGDHTPTIPMIAAQEGPDEATRHRILLAELRSIRQQNEEQADEIHRLHHMIGELFDLVDRGLQRQEFTPSRVMVLPATEDNW